MIQKRIDGLIGLCKKSGNLIVGAEQVLAEVRKGKKSPFLVLLAEDASENTRKRITNGCAYYGKELVSPPISAERLGRLTGKAGAVACVGICDEGFARAIGAALRNENNESNQREEHK